MLIVLIGSALMNKPASAPPAGAPSLLPTGPVGPRPASSPAMHSSGIHPTMAQRKMIPTGIVKPEGKGLLIIMAWGG